MSLNSAARAAQDPDLQTRIQAAAYDQAVNNANLEKTQFAFQVRSGYANFTSLYWTVGNAVDQEYEAGILAGRGAPGHDPDVVTDGAILAAVVVNWPPDPEPAPPTPAP